MTARVIPFQPRTLASYKARCSDSRCAIVRYYPTPEQAEQWARTHARAYHHPVSLADGRVFDVVNGEAVEYGSFD